MAMEKEFKMTIEPNFDFIIEERGNSSINLRKVSWGDREPKLDLRLWSYKDPEHERPMKGVTLTEEGADELTAVLVENGYGSTDRLLKSLKKRENGKSVEDIGIVEDDGSDEEEGYYDPSELFGAVI